MSKKKQKEEQLEEALRQLDLAVGEETYQWFSTNAPLLLEAVEQGINDGLAGWQIVNHISSRVGPDRSALIQRVKLLCQYLEANGG